jgi:LPXTG-motif cell wall-anchored protein
MMRRRAGLLMGLVGVLLVVGTGPAGAESAAEPEQLSSPTASLTIGKAVMPGAGETDISFSFGGSLGDFGLAEGESVTFAGLAPGSYTVAEILPAGWQLEGVTCLGVEAQVSAADKSVTVTLEQGQPAACTFHNYQEEVAGPELPNTGSPEFTLPLLVGGLWALLVGLTLAVWSAIRRSDQV